MTATIDWMQAAAHYTTTLERVRTLRDRAISAARTQGTVSEVSKATGLSDHRIRQFRAEVPRDHHGVALIDPVADYDLDQSSPSRSYSLSDLGDRVERFPCVEAFLEEDPQRSAEPAVELLTGLCDAGAHLWALHLLPATGDIYAQAANGKVAHLGAIADAGLAREAFTLPEGTLYGRPGGLGWAYGRIQFVNRICSHRQASCDNH